MQSTQPDLNRVINTLPTHRVTGTEAGSPESALGGYYEARAPEYDSVYLKPERQTDLRGIEAWLPPLFAHLRVLEIACGTGYWTQFIAPRAAECVALDAAPQTLHIARQRVARASVEFIVGDAYRLDPDLGQFDAIFAGFWFSHIPKSRRQEFLLGLDARLKPGARVVFLDNRFVEGSSSPISDWDDEGNSYQTRCLADGSSHRILKNFPSQDELQSTLGHMGSQGNWTSWPYYWAFEYRTGALSQADLKSLPTDAAGLTGVVHAALMPWEESRNHG